MDEPGEKYVKSPISVASAWMVRVNCFVWFSLLYSQQRCGFREMKWVPYGRIPKWPPHRSSDQTGHWQASSTRPTRRVWATRRYPLDYLQRYAMWRYPAGGEGLVDLQVHFRHTYSAYWQVHLKTAFISLFQRLNITKRTDIIYVFVGISWGEEKKNTKFAYHP